MISLLDLLLTSWEALLRSVGRSLLTMLGIIIGVGSVIVSMAIGAGAQSAIVEQIESLGANLIIVLPGSISSGGVSLGSGARTSLKPEDVSAISAIVPSVAAAAPYSQTNTQVIAGGTNWFTMIVGTTPSWTVVGNWNLAEGRMIVEQELISRAKVAVLGDTVAKNLFPSGGAVGRVVIIKNIPFRVVGVLAPKGQSEFGRDQDDLVAIPITSYQKRLTGQSWVNAIMVWADTADSVPGVIDSMDRLLRVRHDLSPSESDDFTIRNVANVQAALFAAVRSQVLLLVAIAVVSLVVGGIGIMNIMLVSVTERTKEIGIRMAVGARSRDILLQFLVEAFSLSMAGGVVGIALGVGAARVVSLVSHWPTIITPFSVALGSASAALTGIAFGYFPAWRAARLDPIDALRYE
jgi:putative ABC transport system permease protein